MKGKAEHQLGVLVHFDKKLRSHTAIRARLTRRTERMIQSSGRKHEHTLIAKLWPDILTQDLVRLSKVVFEQIEKGGIVLLGNSRVFHDECAVLDESVGSSGRCPPLDYGHGSSSCSKRL